MADASQDPFDPAGALAAMRASQAKVLKANACPPWRHAVFATLLSGVVAAQALPTKAFFAVIAGLMIGLVATYVVIKAWKGVFINGWRAGATRGVSAAIFAVYLVIYMITWMLREGTDLWFAPLIGAAILFPMAWYASRRWMQVYRRELAA